MSKNIHDEYAFNTSIQPLKQWLERRLKRGQRDVIDNLAKRIIADTDIPRQASRSMYLAHLRAKGYSADDVQTFLLAWQEMRTELLKESE